MIEQPVSIAISLNNWTIFLRWYRLFNLINGSFNRRLAAVNFLSTCSGVISGDCGSNICLYNWLNLSAGEGISNTRLRLLSVSSSLWSPPPLGGRIVSVTSGISATRAKMNVIIIIGHEMRHFRIIGTTIFGFIIVIRQYWNQYGKSLHYIDQLRSSSERIDCAKIKLLSDCKKLHCLENQ